MQDFAEIYSGPEFAIHYKYSYILTVVFIAFFFGPLLPILFPMAAASIMCQYTVEKLAMAFSYKKPPMYDNKITLFALRVLVLAPILYALTASWAFSNQ